MTKYRLIQFISLCIFYVILSFFFLQNKPSTIALLKQNIYLHTRAFNTAMFRINISIAFNSRQIQRHMLYALYVHVSIPENLLSSVFHFPHPPSVAPIRLPTTLSCLNKSFDGKKVLLFCCAHSFTS